MFLTAQPINIHFRLLSKETQCNLSGGLSSLLKMWPTYCRITIPDQYPPLQPAALAPAPPI